MRKLLKNDAFLYIICGILTTAVNYAVFWVFYDFLWNQQYSGVANTIAFVAGLIFAFVVNKLFVFESKVWNVRVLRHEIPTFVSGRIGTFAVEQITLFLCDNIFHLGGVTAVTIGGWNADWIAIVKILLSGFAMIANYAICKLIVFARKENNI